ncbi:hypothetical protein ABGF48_05505 [Helcococcus bovis]|uniref:hypothetical protein n=1 Tax=Helcococcus bovis TaxID=3153252 RepID=UPI0038BDA6F9
MKNYYFQFNLLKKLLKHILNYYKKLYNSLPENEESFGSLRIKDRNAFYHVYRDKVSGKLKNEYIKDKAKIKSLAQKTYNKKVKNMLHKNINVMLKLDKVLEMGSVDDFYLNLSSHRKNIVTPVDNTHVNYFNQWKIKNMIHYHLEILIKRF